LSQSEKREPQKKPGESEATTANPAEASELQAGVDQILVDHELEQGRTVKIPQPKRRRVVFKY
jgi:hypothetical protein